MFLTVYADAAGHIYEHPNLSLTGRSGNGWTEPLEEEMIPLPEGASIAVIPGFSPVGINKHGKPEVITEDLYGLPGKAQALAALLPQGFTRTLLPACVSEKGCIMPIMGYASLGFKDGKFWVAAVQSDEDRKWNPRYYNQDDLPERVEKLNLLMPENPIIHQLSLCALEYNCFTSQNIFHERWEGGIPTYNKCNANCIGCLSEAHMDTDSPQHRIQILPEVPHISELCIHHLQCASEGIVSFGQGCEGDPSLNAVKLASSIREIRYTTQKGTININSNAGYTKGIVSLTDAGLDSMRVTMFSAVEASYNAYHRPRGYSLKDVENTIDYAKKNGVNVSINALVFPGFSDRESEIEAWLEFIEKHKIDLFQLRNLNIDPDVLYNEIVPSNEETYGMLTLIDNLKTNAVGMKIGSYTHPIR